MRYLVCVVAIFLAAAEVSGAGWRPRRFARRSCSASKATAAKARPAAPAFVVQSPLRYANLTIFPVVSTTPKLVDRYTTLSEGLRNRTVDILEVGTASRSGRNDEASADDVVPEDADEAEDEAEFANEVNKLVAVNRSAKPLYLMPGEIIVGGDQDRTIARETIVAADGLPHEIEVYCVEEGRWGGRDLDEAAEVAAELGGESVNPEEAAGLAREAAQGKFVVEAGSLDRRSRLKVQAGYGQQEVWEGVREFGYNLTLITETTAFSANYTDDGVAARLGPYIENLQDRVKNTPHVIGVVIAVNGKPVSADAFESTPLFLKLWPELLKSAALDALNGVEKDEAARECTLVEAREFVAQAGRAKVAADQSSGNLVFKSTNDDESAPFVISLIPVIDGVPVHRPAGGMGGGMFGGGVHSSAISK